ncbi:MAG: hypothetical protein JXC32_20985, partial [Anaerolineae bacterium]|nr:hypothetical protein [Anaerolineae bacterium]
WADSFDSWADAETNLVRAFTVWEGGYSSWAGGCAAWPGSFDSWADNVGDPAWAADYAALANLPTDLSPVSINLWVDIQE